MRQEAARRATLLADAGVPMIVLLSPEGFNGAIVALGAAALLYWTLTRGGTTA